MIELRATLSVEFRLLQKIAMFMQHMLVSCGKQRVVMVSTVTCRRKISMPSHHISLEEQWRLPEVELLTDGIAVMEKRKGSYKRRESMAKSSSCVNCIVIKIIMSINKCLPFQY
ncbi:hypothetical protein OIU84_011944 [Salix udensis]|uniref:Uncharacterized protein n=1 Tax=Salix udensis TaxID=889485 RepID=A0AAD6JEX3_9ROSI|nr:hypothetical protein OIU84_011944 [Salix udensis]